MQPHQAARKLPLADLVYRPKAASAGLNLPLKRTLAGVDSQHAVSESLRWRGPGLTRGSSAPGLARPRDRQRACSGLVARLGDPTTSVRGVEFAHLTHLQISEGQVPV